MSGTLVIALPAMPGDPVLWGLFADGLTASGRALADVPADRADQVWAVVPGGDVLMRRVEIPARSDAQARAALPYLLEDDVAVELDGLHFAMGPAGGDGRRPVAVVSKTKMDTWTGLLAETGLKADRLIADFEAVAGPDDGRVLVDLGARVIAGGEAGGFSVETDLAARILGGRDEIEADALRVTDRELLGLYYEGLADRAPVNLLQGAYTPRPPLKETLSAWRIAAALALLVVIGAAAQSVLQTWKYQEGAEAYRAQADQVFREAFPEVKRVVNPRAQLRSELAALRATRADGFFRLSQTLFDGIETMEGVRVEALRFDAERGEIVADLSYGSFDDVERLRMAVAEQGARLEEGGSRQQGGRIVGDVTVSLP